MSRSLNMGVRWTWGVAFLMQNTGQNFSFWSRAPLAGRGRVEGEGLRVEH